MNTISAFWTMGRSVFQPPRKRHVVAAQVKRFRSRPTSAGGTVGAADRPSDRVDVKYPCCMDAEECASKPAEAASNDPEVLRAALLRESGERRPAECRADMQTEIVNLA